MGVLKRRNQRPQFRSLLDAAQTLTTQSWSAFITSALSASRSAPTEITLIFISRPKSFVGLLAIGDALEVRLGEGPRGPFVLWARVPPRTPQQQLQAATVPVPVPVANPPPRDWHTRVPAGSKASGEGCFGYSSWAHPSTNYRQEENLCNLVNSISENVELFSLCRVLSCKKQPAS